MTYSLCEVDFHTLSDLLLDFKKVRHVALQYIYNTI